MPFSLASLFGSEDGPPDTQDPRILYGVYLGSSGEALAGVKPELDRLFSVRIATLPGIPSDWLTRVRQLQLDNPGSLVRLAPSRMGDVQQTPSATRAWFLSTPAQLDAWMEMFRRSNDLVSQYAANPDPSWITQFYRWTTNDENWVAVGQAFAATGQAIVKGEQQVVQAVGDTIDAANRGAKQGLEDAGNFLDRFNPFSTFTKTATQVTWIVVALVAVVLGFFAWRSGLLDAAAKAIPASKKPPARKAVKP